MLTKFINFVDDLQKARNAVRSCQKSVDAAWNKLSDGNKNHISQAQKLHSMVIEGKKKPTAVVFQQQSVGEADEIPSEEAEDGVVVEVDVESADV